MSEMFDDEKEGGSGDKAQAKTDVFGELHGESRLLDRIAIVLIAHGNRRSQTRLGPIGSIEDIPGDTNHNSMGESQAWGQRSDRPGSTDDPRLYLNRSELRSASFSAGRAAGIAP
jgi:hypothetical protein